MRKLLLWTLSASIMTGITSVTSAPIPTLKNGDQNVTTMAQPDSSEVVLFYFVPKSSKFFYEGNEKSIRQAHEMIERHRADIVRGDMLIRINGYCSSFQTEKTNLKVARLRSSHVKSSFIVDLGMKEKYYLTTNHTEQYGTNARVGVTASLVHRVTEPLEKPDTAASHTDEIECDDTAALRNDSSDEPALTTTPATATDAATAAAESPETDRPAWEQAHWSLKTNLAGWALVVTNVAAEYRFADHWSVDVPLYYSCWTTAPKYRFRTLAAQPSLRYWLSPEWKGHFFGVHVTAGQFNVSVGSDTRYQDTDGMYGAGLDYGYAFKFSERWGLEFNIGAGYINTRYNAYYNVDNGALFNTATKNYWGITRCGISLIYRIK